MLNIRFILKLTICVFFLIQYSLAQNLKSPNDFTAYQLSLFEQNKDVSTTSNKQKTMKINTDLIINGDIHSGRVICEKITVKEKGIIKGTLKTTEVIIDKLTTESTIVNSLISPNGIIIIDGDVLITNEISSEILQNINLKGASFAIDGVNQFGLIHHDDFDSKESLNGWSHTQTNRCSENGNFFLGGHCIFSNEDVTKQYQLPEHNTIRVSAGFHMFDNWNGEHGYMKIDDDVVWSREGQIDKEAGINFCGGEWNDPAFNLEIDITIPHINENVTITFGSTLEGDPCNASFGVDDVMIYVK